MAFALLVLRALDCVEVVDMRVATDAGSKHMATVAEPDLSAILYRDVVILHDAVTEDIHQEKFVTNSSHNMEATRMDRHSSSVFTDRSLVANFILAFSVVPNHNVGS